MGNEKEDHHCRHRHRRLKQRVVGFGLSLKSRHHGGRGRRSHTDHKIDGSGQQHGLFQADKGCDLDLLKSSHGTNPGEPAIL